MRWGRDVNILQNSKSRLDFQYLYNEVMVSSNINSTYFKEKNANNNNNNKVGGNYLLNKSMEFKEKKYFQDSN